MREPCRTRNSKYPEQTPVEVFWRETEKKFHCRKRVWKGYLRNENSKYPEQTPVEVFRRETEKKFHC